MELDAAPRLGVLRRADGSQAPLERLDRRLVLRDRVRIPARAEGRGRLAQKLASFFRPRRLIGRGLEAQIAALQLRRLSRTHTNRRRLPRAAGRVR